MGKRKAKIINKTNTSILIVVFLVCASFMGFTGCSSQNNSSVQKDEPSSGKNEDAKDAEEEETITKELPEENSQEPVQDEDLAASPLDLGKLELADKIEESGISYYNFHTSGQTPLPMEEWAKLNLISEKGAVVPAYIRFTNVTKDIKNIEKQMKQFMEIKNSKALFHPQPMDAEDEYVMMDYEILIGEEASLEQDDYISFSAVRFPLQLYSTMRSGTWGEHADADAKRVVSDISIYDTDTRLVSGSRIKKTMMCSVPKGYTAYGVMIPYMGVQGDSECIYYKLEYK